MKAHILALAAGIAVFAGFSPYIPADVLHGKWGNVRTYSAADLADGHINAAIDKGTTFFRTAALASEGDTATPPIDVSKLVKIDDVSYDISHDDSVSLTPITSVSVKKIGYGHITDVRIVTTSSGTYSTDGFASKNVLYTGIQANRVADQDGFITAFMWLNGSKWVGIAAPKGKGSFVHFGPMQGGGGYVTSKNGNCFFGKNFAGCN